MNALEFMARVTAHRAIAVVISDFLECGETLRSATKPLSSKRRATHPKARSIIAQSKTAAGPLSKPVQTSLRMLNRKHDVVAVQITDRYELELPKLGRLILEDAETGDIVELNTASAGSRDAFVLRQEKSRGEIARQFRSFGH